LLAKAQQEFDKLPVRGVISWTALLAGYAHHGYGEEALKCFERMQHEGISPNAVTFICALKACGSVGAVAKGQQIHAEVVDEGVFERDSLVRTSVVDMYAKCGALAKAQEVFDKLPKRDAIAWNALITGYAQLGNSDAVFGLFGKMAEEGGTEPDAATFSILLNTCCHLGLIEKGQMCFRAMHTNYGIVPTLEHHGCMVDLYGRAGHVGEAMSMIKGMPYSADSTMWHILLSACGRWGDANVGNVVFEHAVDLDANDAVSYVCMSNIYAASGLAEGESTQG
jgi:pentatricopeptide repeat protein